MRPAGVSRPLAALLLAASPLAQASTFDGTGLTAWWGLPFAGMLLSIAVGPLLAPRWWHRHFGKVAGGWALLFLLPFTLAHGGAATAGVMAHTLLAEYLPFIILLSTLFTVAGGIHVRGNLRGSPGINVGLMAVGAMLASFMGTTGASMLMIRPLIRANDNRKHCAHVIIFFIFIVGNAAGALTPLGDPPLFLGFLQGVDFFWTTRHLLPQTLFVVVSLLAVFYVVDRHRYGRHGVHPQDPTPDDGGFGLEGGTNFLLLGGVVALVLMSGVWQPGLSWQVLGTEVGLPQIARDLGLICLLAISWWHTPQRVRQANQFSWGPMAEVAKLFIGIFITMVPVLAMLKAGEAGAFGAVASSVTGPDGRPEPWAYFWFSGVLSAFLDNAPTYLVFFNLAGGDPQALMTSLAPTLAAISAGSVFMGAFTYIGNAPNFMVKAIAEDRGIQMPSFFGYMGWSFAVLMPLFLVVSLLFFR
jgi:Na+/H+ antiporter NhaD/arsenite permease-like protein